MDSSPALPEADEHEPPIPQAGDERRQREELDEAPSEGPIDEKVADEPAGEKQPDTAPPALDDLPSWDEAPAEGDAALGQNLDADWDAAAGPEAQVTFPWIESHGYFRLRTDLFHNFDLDTYDRTAGEGSSPFRPPLTETDTQGSQHPETPGHRYDRGADSQAGANIRFRYQPTVHVTENLRVRTTLDVLDNLVLGSTPDGAPFRGGPVRPDVTFETFSGTQVPPESGRTSWRDSVRVKHLWGEWKTPLGLLVFGRTMSHWGLGLLANGGNCLDCDFGDSVDRIMGVTKLFDTYLAVAWDFPAEGAIGMPGQLQTLYNQPLGQAYDVDQRDDVNEWVIAIFQRPVTRREKEVRDRELNELREPVFDWGVYNVIRNQTFIATTDPGLLPPESREDYNLRDVKAFAYIPDVWLNFEYRPRRNHTYQIQFEGAGVFGVVEEVPLRPTIGKYRCLDPDVDLDVQPLDDCPGGDLVRPRKRDILQLGYALEFDARMDKLRYGFHQGVASGDDTPGFGVIDQIPIDPENPQDQEVNSFKFDRDYHVDLILFRELIGTVTNAAYFKPYIGYDLILQDDEAWGFQLSSIYAFALEPEATPGRERPLGLEFDLELYIHEIDTFKWSLAYGILFPMGAFDYLEFDQGQLVGTDEPGIAQTVQMMIGMMF